MDLIDEGADPFALFTDWFADAEKSEPNDPNAMTVSTVDEAGLPDARILLLKGRTSDGFVFYTNLTSEKGKQLLAARKCALLFHWKSARRQIRMRGPVSLVSDDTADAYFATRRRMSQIGAWASDQSSPLDSRDTFEARIANFETRFKGQDVPRPPHWSGFCLIPDVMEFWQDRDFRLHDRVRYSRGSDAGWSGQRLYP
ncbi:MAG: pyridoxamine 5'-phosphate oxidase [Pseudomonadota bacterium]